MIFSMRLYFINLGSVLDLDYTAAWLIKISFGKDKY